MTSSASTTTPGKHAFERRVENVKCPKSDINALILDYLTTEGYPQAAANFSMEANLPTSQDHESIQARQEIQNAIHSGDIEAAIESLNELEPEILDEDESLHFSLLRLQLVELIRTCNIEGGDIAPAVSFAQEQLGPRAPANQQFLEDLEMTMSLLFFPSDSLEPQLAALLDPSLRREAADRVNKAILQRQSMRTMAGIRDLVRLRSWAESQARDEGTIALPDRLDVGLHGEETDSHGTSRSNNGNGHEPMITT